MSNDTTPSTYINGRWQVGDGPLFTSYNPADNSVIWCGHSGSLQQITQAIIAAKEAFPFWSNLQLHERRSYLDRARAVIHERAPSLIALLAKESGKPLWEAKTEIDAVLDKFGISYTAYEERCQQRVLSLAQASAVVRHKPHGVMAVLGPFNLPAHLPHGHIIPALLAGNTVVFKPSELTPTIAEAMVHCWHDSGLPPGVLNMIQGGRDVGAALSSEPALDGLLFTGSWQTGERLTTASKGYPGRILALEMGGNNPLIVWHCKDHTAAAYITIQSAFITSGQRCSCARRLIISDDNAGNLFIKRLVELTKDIIIGPYDAVPAPFMGPLINTAAADHVFASYHALLEKGAFPLLPMNRPHGDAFVTPAIVDVTSLTDRTDEEIFGPLLQVLRVPTFEEAITAAQATKYGLSAGILTDEVAHYSAFWQHVQAGVINWNMPLTGMPSRLPFGGIGQSGNWRPSAYYAADYSAYPVSSVEAPYVQLPKSLPPGLPLP